MPGAETFLSRPGQYSLQGAYADSIDGLPEVNSAFRREVESNAIKCAVTNCLDK
jgi:hypothetical protein